MMKNPDNCNLPFFTYGIFKPKQISFFQIKDFVVKIYPDVSVPGNLMIRDGLPLLDMKKGAERVKGALLFFSGETGEDAYSRIAKLEPDHQYRWSQTEIGLERANVLVGISPNRGSVSYEENEWDSWADPFFGPALKVVSETLEANSANHGDEKSIFRLQMAYLLLWSSIERYASLRYSLSGPSNSGGVCTSSGGVCTSSGGVCTSSGGVCTYGETSVTEKLHRMAREDAFAAGLIKRVRAERNVFRSNNPAKGAKLNPNNPLGSIDYYYQVRSNATHRGKTNRMDRDTVCASLSELLPIFDEMLDAAGRPRPRF